jgi:hypothetical protein
MHTFIRIISADEKSPAGKLADAELHSRATTSLA